MEHTRSGTKLLWKTCSVRMMPGSYKEWNQTMMEDMLSKNDECSIQGVEPNYDGRHVQ